jgi:hypothetical protein
MTLRMITHRMRRINGLYALRDYARTHPPCHGWAYAIDTILTRLGVRRG